MNVQAPHELLAYIGSQKGPAIDFLRRLVAFDSTFTNQGVGGNELGIQRWLEGELRSWGLATRLFEPDNRKLERYGDFNPGHDYTGRPNLVAVLKGRGGGRSLILNGHVDTVPVGDATLWTHPPFAGETVAEEMYGRGTCDMKAGLAAMMLAVKCLRETGWEPRGDVIIESVVDEEGGGNGTLACVAEGYRADAAVVCEPTDLKVLAASRGVFLLRIDVRGKSTHAALKWCGVNAVEKAMKIAQGLGELERLWLATRKHPLLPSPTITLGQIAGGVAGAVVPEECVMKFDIKYLPAEADADGRETAVRGDDIKATVERWIATICAGDPWLREHPPALEWYLHVRPHHLDPAHPLVATMAAACRQVTGSGSVSGMPSGSDARILQNEGEIPTVIFGPGNLADAHGVDEHISLTRYLESIKVLAAGIREWSS